MAFPIDTLRMFCLLAQKLNFTETANYLNINQSTLSRKIHQLEQTTQLRLFHRGGNQIHLTPQGRVFLESCQRILQEWDNTLDSLHDDQDYLRGDIKLGLLHPMARWLSQTFFREFCAKHPHIRLHLTTLHPTNLREMADCDIMIAPFLPCDQSLVAKPLAKYRRVFCASPQYIAQHGLPRHPQELSQHQCITNTNCPNQELSWKWESKEAEGVVDVSGTISTDSVDIATNLALAGMGIALIPLDQINHLLEKGELVDVFNCEYYQWGELYAVYRSRQYTPERFAVFMTELRQYISSHCNTHSGPNRMKVVPAAPLSSYAAMPAHP